MYGSGGDQAASIRPAQNGYGTLAGPSAVARDVGAIGMAANRLRAVNRSIDQAISSLRAAHGRITEQGEGKSAGNVPGDPPPPAQTIPGLLREIEAAESLVMSLSEAIRFTDSL